jgi:tetratricopeptide (TPR) repeat protein
MRQLGSGGPADIKASLDRAQDDLRLVDRLVAIRSKSSAMDREYEEAFRSAGMVEVGGATLAAAEWMGAKAVRDALMVELLNWADCTGDGQRRAWLLGVATCVNPETTCRRELSGYQERLGTEHPETLRSLRRLATCLQKLGKYTEAEQMFRQTLEGSRRLLGDVHPDSVRALSNLAVNLRAQNRYAAATRLYTDAFTAQPKLADDLQAGHRYNAACCAALAGSGQGGDAAKLDDKERARLRQQSLGWLRADLAAWGKQGESGTPQTRAVVQKTLQHWQEDSDLAGVRDAAALEKLPEAEHTEWNKLWADVDATVKKAAKPDKQ